MRLHKPLRCLATIIILLSASTQTLSLSKDEAVEKLIEKFQQQHFLQGSFSQQRTLEGFSRPLTSSGQFKFWQSHGLYWQTDHPFFNALTYSHKEILYWSTSGELISGQAPNVTERHINKILLAIFSADIEELKKTFRLEINYQNDNDWNIELTPGNPMISQALDRVTLSGSDYLNKATILSPNGSLNTIVFSSIQHSEKPDQEQCKLFFSTASPSCR